MNISIRNCIFVIALVGFSPLLVNAQTVQQKNTVPPKKVVPTAPKPSVTAAADEEVDIVDIQRAISEVVGLFKKEKENDPVPVTLVMSYANSFTEFSKFSRIETDTRISLAWYKNVSESLSKLVEIKSNIKTATFNKEAGLEELKKTYKESVARIIYLLEHPQKISEKK